MNKRLAVVGAVIIVGGGLVWFGVKWWGVRAEYASAFTDKDLARAAKRLGLERPAQPEVVPAVPIPLSHNVRLAIGWLGLPNQAQNLEVADLLTVELTGAKGLELVERKSLDRVLGELELNLAGLVRAKDAVRAGKLLKAEWFVLGSTAPAGAGNAVIARIVDAQTGVMRDVGVFPCDGLSPALATKLAQFVRACRQAGSEAKPRVFLAVGTFQDLSLNNRLGEFPQQLRTQLIEAYQGSGVTLLEREYVNALLQEVRLDLAGLIDSRAAALPRMQSGFWLVDGAYQSYETSGYEVELGLKIKRIFGRETTVLLREKPGQPLVSKVKAEIDKALSAGVAIVAPTRYSEARAQMEAGKELFVPSDSGWGRVGPETYLIHGSFGVADDRQRRNLEEAIRAFQTVLLFEPTNREAKLYLAAAMRSPPLYRELEARPYYREVLDEPVKDRWVAIAQQALGSSLRMAGPEERARWLQPIALQPTNPSAAFFQSESRRAALSATLQRGDSPKRQEFAEERLFDTIKQFDSGRWYQEEIGMGEFVEDLGVGPAAGARRLVELYPKMKLQASNSAPYLLASIVAHQVDTNAQVITEFEQALEEWVAHPDKVQKRVTPLWSHVNVVYRWSEQHQLPALGAKVLEARARLQGGKAAGDLAGDDQDKMRRAFGYQAAGRWQDALKVFESYTNHPVRMGGSGPWGPAFTVVLTGRQATECRKQLGLPAVQDPREFDLGKPLLCVHGPRSARQYEVLFDRMGTFAADNEGLWLGFAGKLLRLDFDLHTNLVIALPIDEETPITCLWATSDRIWIGTHGEGLIECDPVKHQCIHMTEKEGLLMDFISCLQAAGETLWIGYNNRSGGGLGKLDLKTRHATSFMPSLADQGRLKPPRSPIVSLAVGTEDDVWFVTGSDVRRYRSRVEEWETPLGLSRAGAVSCVADNLSVGMGHYGTYSSPNRDGLGLRTRSVKAGVWKVFPEIAELPTSVLTLAPDGPFVWVGGEAYLALVDPVQDKVLRFAYVSARAVDQIQLGGGYVWAQCEKHLYKAPLSARR